MSEVQEQPVESQEVESQDEESSVTDSVEEVQDQLEGEQEESQEASEKKEEEVKAEAKNQLKKKLKAKIDGKEEEVELDFENDEELLRYVQKAKAFDKRAQEFTSLQKQVDKFLGDLKSNPASILKELGLNFDELAEKHLEQLVEEAKKSPEQIEREKLEAELKSMKEEKDRIAEEKEEAEMERLRNHYASQIETDIDQALSDSNSTLPRKNPFVIKRIAETMMLAIQNGMSDITPKQVIPLVEEQFKKDLQSMFAVMPEEVLEKLVGEDNFERVRKKRLQRNKKPISSASQISETGKKSEVGNKKEEVVDYSKFFGI